MSASGACYVLHQVHVRIIQETFPLKARSDQELGQLHAHLEKYIRVLNVSREYNIETYLAAAIELKLGEGTKLRWTTYSRKCVT